MASTKDAETTTASIATSDAEVTENGYQSSEPSPVFHYFLKLPAEIRSQIYHDVASFDKHGPATLFSTSKQMRNEGAEVSARHCSFKLWLGSPRRALWDHLPEATLDLKATAVIQNVSLILYMDGVRNPWQVSREPLYKLIGYFRGSQIMRESCQIVLFYGRTGYLSRTCASTTLFRTLRQLSNFRSMTIVLKCFDDRRFGALCPIIKHIRNADLYAQRVKVALEPALGPARVGMDENMKGTQKLVFHPLEWKLRTDQHSDLA